MTRHTMTIIRISETKFIVRGGVTDFTNPTVATNLLITKLRVREWELRQRIWGGEDWKPAFAHIGVYPTKDLALVYAGAWLQRVSPLGRLAGP